MDKNELAHVEINSNHKLTPMLFLANLNSNKLA